MDAGLGGWLGTIVIGGIAGWVASMVMKTDASMGVVANVVVGVVGALLANFLLPVFGIAGTTDSSPAESSSAAPVRPPPLDRALGRKSAGSAARRSAVRGRPSTLAQPRCPRAAASYSGP